MGGRERVGEREGERERETKKKAAERWRWWEGIQREEIRGEGCGQ